MKNTHYSTLVDVAIARSAQYGDKPLYRFIGQHNEVVRSISFQELDGFARQWATLLRDHGSKPGDRTLLLMGHEPTYITAFWGCLYAGTIAVPVFPPKTNKSSEIERLLAIVKDCEPTTILASEKFIPTAKAIVDQLPTLEITVIPAARSQEEIQITAKENFTPFPATQDTLAFLQYTSGSTGVPKGVMVSHGNLIANETAITEQFSVTPNDILFSWLPFYHDMGLIGGIIQPLFTGMSSILMPPMQFIQSPLNWLRGLSTFKATVMVGPNFSYDYCCDKIDNAKLPDIDLSNIRIAVNGAEPISPATMERFVNYFWQTGIRKNVFSPSYGLAEATLLVSCQPAVKPVTVLEVSQQALQQNHISNPKNHQDLLRLAGSGPVAKHHSVAIVDPQNQSRCSEDIVGEVWVCGPSVTEGYWKKSDLNKSIFGLTLKESEQLFVNTGDYGFIRKDELFITGREKELVIIRGRNFYPQDIEKAIERQVRDIQPSRIAAFSVTDENTERLIVVAEPNRKGIRENNFNEIAQRCSLALNTIMGISADEIIIAKLGTITKTSSGKTQRTRCKEKYLNKDIVAYASLIKESRAVSATETISHQKIDISTIEDCSGFLKQQISIITGVDNALLDHHLPLTALGLDSLHVVELIKSVRFATGVNITIEQILSDTTINALAHEIVNGTLNSYPRIEPLTLSATQDNNAVPQSFQQQRLWYINQLSPSNNSHNIVIDVTFGHGIDPDRLASSLHTLSTRHEILRTVFSSEDGKPLQRVLESIPSNFTIEKTGIEILQLCNDKVKTHTFDLSSGPLWNAQLIPISEHESHLLLSFHHIIFDGVSANILCQELSSLYADNSDLPTLQHQYRDYSRWQRQQIEQGLWDDQLAYWRKQLYQAKAIGLACERNPIAETQTTSNTLPFTLSKDSQITVKSFAQKHQLTPFMVLLGAFYITLHYQTDESDITIGTDTANRPLYEWQQQLGFFVNQLALRLNIETNQTVEAFYQGLRKHTLAAYERQSFPFDQIVSALNPERHGNKTPFFSTKLVWQRLDLNASEQSELTITDIHIEQQASEFDLVLDFVESQQGLTALFKFNPKLVSLPDVERFSALYTLSLDTLISNSRLSLNQVTQRLAQADISHIRAQQPRQQGNIKIRRRRSEVSV